MKRLRAARHGAACALAALVLTSCAPVTVTTFVEPGIDFSRYRTYDWESSSGWTGDPRLDNNPFFHDHLRSAVDSTLLARGIERTTFGLADLSIRYHASTTQELYVSEGASQEGSCADCRLEVYDAGTILIDLVDGRTNRLLWRGWAESSIDGVIDSQRLMEQRIDEAVARIIEKLPRGFGRPRALS